MTDDLDDALDGLGRALVAAAGSSPENERAVWLAQLTAEGFRVLHAVEDQEDRRDGP